MTVNRAKSHRAIAIAKTTLEQLFNLDLRLTVDRDRCMGLEVCTFGLFQSSDRSSLGKTIRVDIKDNDVFTAKDDDALARWIVCHVLFYKTGDPDPNQKEVNP